MRPPEFTGGNDSGGHRGFDVGNASMRPPEFTGGNVSGKTIDAIKLLFASMRPPEFTGGNRPPQGEHRRGTQASMRPPEFTGGNLP